MKHDVAPESIMAFPWKGLAKKLDFWDLGVSHGFAENDAYI